MSQRVKRKNRKQAQRERANQGLWRLLDAEGYVVGYAPGVPMRFPTREAAEQRMREANWDTIGMVVALCAP